MLDQLAARNRDVQRAAVVLEHKVEERTQELAQSNTELKDTIVLLERTRNQLVLAEKLSALGQMAAGIAHEINNPAAVILGNLDVLSAELGAQARPVAREIDLIAQQVERIRHIVTSLLQFARARPGEGQVEEVRVNQLIEDVLPLVSHALKAKSLVLRRRLEATGTVAINLYDLEQVLINLIVNAANACDDGGRIEIATADAPPDGAVISVADNGHGIAAEHIKRVFDPFFTTDNQRGVGLGLSVSYGLVHRYGGDITVESTPARGTIFHVHLLRHPLTTSTPRALEEMSHG
jgi:two-component system NtrC family sensor kinase